MEIAEDFKLHQVFYEYSREFPLRFVRKCLTLFLIKKDWLWQILLDFVTIGLTRQQSLLTSNFWR